MTPKQELTLILNSINDAHTTEEVLCLSANMLDRYSVNPENNITISLCRDFIKEIEKLLHSLNKVNYNMQKNIKNFSDTKLLADKKLNTQAKSGFTSIHHGLQKLSQAANYMGKAVLKSGELIKLDLNVQKPSKTHRFFLQKKIHKYKEKALKLFTAGKKSILLGSQLAAENSIDKAKKLSSKISMTFNKITDSKAPKISLTTESYVFGKNKI